MAPPIRATTGVEDEDTFASQREGMNIVSSLLHNLRGETSRASSSSNLEEEVHHLQIDFLKECRDTGAAQQDWVVRAATESGTMARQLRKV